jgi:acetyl esterase/lipase
MTDEELRKLPPTMVFTSEFDFLRRDALDLISRLKSVNGPYLDHEDMPGVTHGYQYNGNLDQSTLHFKNFSTCFMKYICH